MGRLQEAIAEFRRRRVFRALLGWGVVSFAVLQVTEPILHALDLKDWVLKVVVAVLAAGFPVAAVLSWTFDLGPGGITRTPEAPTVGQAAAPPANRRLALLALVAVAAAVGAGLAVVTLRSLDGARPVEASVAVLPFADMSPLRDQEFLADGMAEEILNALAQVEGLLVSGRTSSFSFKGKPDDIRTIGQKLGVATVLEGSVRRAGSQVRIAAQLVRTSDGFQLWSRTIDREMADVLALQTDVARDVAKALQVKLLPGRGPGARSARAQDPEAYASYLRALELLRTGGIDDAKGALRFAERAVRLDPQMAQGWAGIAHSITWLQSMAGEGVSVEDRARAFEAAERAVALDPGLPEGWAARGWARRAFRFDWRGAMADTEKALSLGPGDSESLRQRGLLLVARGDVRGATAEFERTIRLDPLSTKAWMMLGQAHVSARDHERARAALGRALELAPQNDFPRWVLMAELVSSGRAAEALHLARQGTTAWIRNTGTALALHSLGDEKGSRAALEALVRDNAEDSAYQIAEIHAWRGETDRAFEWLQRAGDVRDPGIFWTLTDPMLAGLHGDPRWRPFLRRVNLE